MASSGGGAAAEGGAAAGEGGSGQDAAGGGQPGDDATGSEGCNCAVPKPVAPRNDWLLVVFGLAVALRRLSGPSRLSKAESR